LDKLISHQRKLISVRPKLISSRVSLCPADLSLRQADVSLFQRERSLFSGTASLRGPGLPVILKERGGPKAIVSGQESTSTRFPNLPQVPSVAARPQEEDRTLHQKESRMPRPNGAEPCVLPDLTASPIDLL
jgi:hypothetical protein